jgi:hypothetical protein
MSITNIHNSSIYKCMTEEFGHSISSKFIWNILRDALVKDNCLMIEYDNCLLVVHGNCLLVYMTTVYHCPPMILFLLSYYFMCITVHLWYYSCCHITSCLFLTTCDVIPGGMLLHVYYWPPVMLFLVSCYFCLLLTTCDVIPGVMLFHVYYCPPVMLFLVSRYFRLLLSTCDVIPGVMLLHVY